MGVLVCMCGQWGRIVCSVGGVDVCVGVGETMGVWGEWICAQSGCVWAMGEVGVHEGVCLWEHAHVSEVYMGDMGVSHEGVCLWERARVSEVYMGNMGVSHEGV